jgi:hypothetical protein
MRALGCPRLWVDYLEFSRGPGQLRTKARPLDVHPVNLLGRFGRQLDPIV